MIKIKVVIRKGIETDNYDLKFEKFDKKIILKKIEEIEEFTKEDYKIFIEGKLIKKNFPKKFDLIIIKKVSRKKEFISNNKSLKNLINSEIFDDQKFEKDFRYYEILQEKNFFDEEYRDNFEIFGKELINEIFFEKNKNIEEENEEENDDENNDDNEDNIFKQKFKEDDEDNIFKQKFKEDDEEDNKEENFMKEENMNREEKLKEKNKLICSIIDQFNLDKKKNLEEEIESDKKNEILKIESYNHRTKSVKNKQSSVKSKRSKKSKKDSTEKKRKKKSKSSKKSNSTNKKKKS